MSCYICLRMVSGYNIPNLTHQIGIGMNWQHYCTNCMVIVWENAVTNLQRQLATETTTDMWNDLDQE